MSLKQQTRLYVAEKCLWGHGREFSSLHEITLYLDSIIHSDWFIKQYGWMPAIQITRMESNKWAGCADRKGYVIYLKRLTENVILHELSHLLCSSDEHDEQFVSIMQNLIRNAMGFYAWAEFTYNLEKENYYER